MIAGLIRWSISNRILVLLATGFLVAWGAYSLHQTPVDALPDLSDVQVIYQDLFSGTGTAGRGGSGYLSADHCDAVCAESGNGTRLFIFRRFLRLHHLRRWHRPLLGTFTGIGIPEPGGSTATRQCQAGARSRCDWRRLDLRIRAGGSNRSE